MIDYVKKAFAIAALRRASYRWPGRYKTLKNAKAARNAYFCAHCPEGVVHERRQVQLDHVSPVVPVEGWDGFDGYIDRMFCDESGYQVLCEEHHSTKTKLENIVRKSEAAKKKLDKA